MESGSQDIKSVSANVELLHEDRKKQLLMRYGCVEPGDDDKFFDYQLHFKTEGQFCTFMAIFFIFKYKIYYDAKNTINLLSSSS